MKHEKTNNILDTLVIAFSYRNLVDLYFFLTSTNELKKELGSKQQPPLEFQAFMGFPILLRWLLDKVATLSFCNSIHLHQFALITFQPWRGEPELSEPWRQWGHAHHRFWQTSYYITLLLTPLGLSDLPTAFGSKIGGLTTN